MNNTQINYFLEVCKTLSFTKAAQNLYVSQPAVSKQIFALEKEIGIQLFERSTKDVALSKAGKLFFDFFVKTAEEYQQTLKDAQKVVSANKKNVLLGFLEGWDLSNYLPYITKSLQFNYPNIFTTFVSYNHHEILNKIENKEIDIAISLSKNFENIPDISLREITTIPSLLFFSVTHPLANKPNLTLYDFKEETFFVFHDQSKINTQDKLIELCKPHGFIPKVYLVPNIESMYLNITNGLGVAVFDEWIQYKHNPMLTSIKTGHDHKVIVVWKDSKLDDMVKSVINEFHSIVSEIK